MSGWRAEARAQWGLALPVIVVQVGMMTMNVVDVFMVGHAAGDAAVQIGAVALGGLYSWLPMGTCMGVLMALDPLVSQAVGAGDHASVARSVQRGLVLAALLTPPLALLMFFSGPLLAAAGQSPQIVPIASEYTRWMALGIPAFLGFVVLRQVLQALHRMRPIVIVILAGNLLNVLFDWAFIHGRLGMPAMGATGCALATSLLRWCMTLGLLAAAWPVLAPYLSTFRRRALELAPLLRMLRLGAPIGAQMLFEMGAFSFIALAMGRLGEVELSGHQIALNLASLAFMVPLGVSMAASVRVGHAIGRQDHEALKCAGRVALAAGGGVMVVSAAIFALAPRGLASLYTDQADVIAMAAALLPLAAIFQVFDGLQVVCAGVLRGAGDTRTPLLLYGLGFWLLGIPLALWLGFSLDQGPRGLWIGLAVALAVVALVLWWRVRWLTASLPARVDVDAEAA